WSGQYCITVYVSGIRFYQPIRIGELVEVSARVIHTGKTSMHIAIDVSASDLKQQKYAKTTHCIIVFVAVDADGRPAPVRPWLPQNEQDQALEQHAIKLMALRKDIEDEMSAYR
ncbi:MAG: acyl-CoA thioesterase, partial [Candidatus Melainabacteria bacterium HGW-Melainabacteria-1]